MYQEWHVSQSDQCVRNTPKRICLFIKPRQGHLFRTSLHCQTWSPTNQPPPDIPRRVAPVEWPKESQQHPWKKLRRKRDHETIPQDPQRNSMNVQTIWRKWCFSWKQHEIESVILFLGRLSFKKTYGFHTNLHILTGWDCWDWVGLVDPFDFFSILLVCWSH